MKISSHEHWLVHNIVQTSMAQFNKIRMVSKNSVIVKHLCETINIGLEQHTEAIHCFSSTGSKSIAFLS